jgi:hypothetical protein
MATAIGGGFLSSNKRLSRRRVVIEHINARIKTFKSMAYPYLGHCCNRHSLRMTVICGGIDHNGIAPF